MKGDELYLSQRGAITMKGLTPKSHKAWVALNLGEAKARLRDISKPIFTKAGIRITGKAEERTKKIDDQKKESRMEAPGGTSVTLPKAPIQQDAHQLMAQARENVRTSGGDASDKQAVLAELRKLKSAAPAA